MKRWLVSVVTLGIVGLVGSFAMRAPATAPAQDHLASTSQLKWYRGNLHTHSFWSDGDDYLENIALWYREQKYDFLAFTDHNTLALSEKWIDVDKAKSGRKAYERLQKNWPDQIVERQRDDKTEVRLKTFAEVVDLVGQPDRFLLIQGEEITDKFGKLPLHLCAANLQDVVPPLGGESVVEVLQNNVNAVIAQRERTKQPMMVHVNHPNFGWAITAEELAQVRGEKFFEVYNGHPGVRNSGDDQHAATERMWDIILTLRLSAGDGEIMWGLATDDGHSYHNIPSRASEPGRGWVMVLAPRLSPDALIGALEAGRFYATSGVTLTAVTTTSDRLSLQIQESPGVTYKTEFIGTRQGYDPTKTPVLDKEGKPLPVTQRYSADVGAVLATVEGLMPSYQFQGDELYVRARVTSSKPHPNPSELGEPERAWVQPQRQTGRK